MLPIQKATYRARAVGAGFGVSENGNTQISITFALLAEDDVMTEEEITWIGHFTSTPDKNGKTLAERTLESLLYMGFSSDDLTLLEEPSRDDVLALLPSAVDIVVEPKKDDANKLEVRWVNRPGGGKFSFKQPLKGNDMKAFAAQMKGTLRNMRGGAPAAPARPAARPANGSSGSKPAPHPNAPGNLDDVPFATCEIEYEPSPIARAFRR